MGSADPAAARRLGVRVPVGTGPFPTSPAPNQYFLLTGPVTTPTALSPGIYKWNGATWVFLGDGTAFPSSPASGDFFRLAEHDVSADATSGAGGDKGKVSIAGALALNLVSNHTEAIVGGGATVNAGTGDVALKAQSNEEDGAKADSDAKSGKVGIGASAAIQVLTDHVTRAAIENGATLSGGAKLELSADSHHDVGTEDKAGSEGGVAISPSVSLAIVKDQTAAYIGTGTGLNVSGDASLSAKEELASSADSNAAAAGNSVAIGAAVSINVIETLTFADLERSLTAASLTMIASTDASSEAKAEASSKGESDSGKSSDNQSKDQVNNNPNSTGKSDGDLPKSQDSTSTANSDSQSNSGEDSGGVNIAAGVALNWARHTTTAQIGNGTVKPTVSTGTGAVKVSSENVIGANAKALGLAVNLDSDVSIGAAVSLNVEDVTNQASIGAGSTVSGGAITVEAVTPDTKENDFVVWAFAVAGGKSDASIAASAGIQVLTFHTTAVIGKGAHVTASDAMDVKATNLIGLQDLAISGALSTSGSAVGGAFAVNILNVTTLAFIDSDTTGGLTCALGTTCVDATTGLSVTAKATLNPVVPDLPEPIKGKVTVPAVSSIAVGGSAGGGDAAVTGSVSTSSTSTR